MSRRGTRRSQVVVPFGIGSIVEFEDEALMPAGLDVWPTDESPELYDNRLARRLRVDHFLVPPPKTERGSAPGTTAPIPTVRFPQWHFCPRCRALRRAGLYDQYRPRCNNKQSSPRMKNKTPCGELPEKRRTMMLPLRFVSVCPEGHIEDFPWNAWAHSERGQDLNPSAGCLPENLYFYATQMSGLSGLMVSCGTCNAKRSLMGATSPQGLKGWKCTGNRPWLGEHAHQTCSVSDTMNMMALQRGASNLYFPEVASSILIPPYSTQIGQILSNPRNRHALESARVNGKVPESSFQTLASLHDVDVGQLKRAYLEQSGEIEEDAAQEEVPFRYAEYLALFEERRDTKDQLMTRPQHVSSYGEIVQTSLEAITLVEQLAETRALVGFSRINPQPGNLSQLCNGKKNWLPAFRVFGEGVFLSFSLGEMSDIDQNATAAVGRLITRSHDWGRAILPVTPSMVFLHTLSHLLIKRLSFEAGYGASSIRERIYAAPAGESNEMAGILLYTAAGDADGTLGGLVGLGKPGNLERLFYGAIEDARWCGSDPICGESEGQGPDGLNLAACHSCCLLPETSCEFQNRLLDRNIVKAYFESYV